MAMTLFMSGVALAVGSVGCVALTGVGTETFRHRIGTAAEVALKAAGACLISSALVS